MEGPHTLHTHPFPSPILSSHLRTQVTLLGSGRLLYHGPTPGMAPWLSTAFRTFYAAEVHGSASDWALDLVSAAMRCERLGGGSSYDGAISGLDGSDHGMFSDVAIGHGADDATGADSRADSGSGGISSSSGARAGGVGRGGGVGRMCHVGAAGLSSGLPDPNHRRSSDLCRIDRAADAFLVTYLADGTPHHTSSQALFTSAAGHTRGGTPGGLVSIPSAPELRATAVLEGASMDGGGGHSSGGGGDWHASLSSRWSSFITRFGTLLWREVVVMTRNPADVAGARWS